MANQVITPTWVMKQITRRLVNNWVFANNVQRGYDSQYVQKGAKMGSTVKARLPQRYLVHKGAGMVEQNTDDQTVDITLTDQAHVGIAFGLWTLTVDVDNYKEKYIAPAVDALLNQSDLDGLQRMTDATFLYFGTPGVPPGSTGTLPYSANLPYLQANAKLSEMSVPENRIGMLNPTMHAFLAGGNVTLMQPAEAISKQYRKGMFSGPALGTDEWFKVQNVKSHTIGPLGGAPVVNGAGQTGSTLNVSGLTAAVGRRWNKGDVIQIAAVNAINPLSYQDNTRQMDFVVTANVDSAVDGTASVPIYPPLIGPGSARATVTALPAHGAAITTFGHASSFANVVSPQGLIYHEDAYAMVMADLEQPGGVWVSERISNKKLGISVRFVKDYNIREDNSPARVDILYGWAAIRPELGLRIAA